MKSRKLLIRLCKDLKKYLKDFIILFVICLFTMLGTTAIAVVTKQIIDNAVTNNDYNRLFLLVMLLSIISVICEILSIINQNLSAKVGNKISSYFRVEIIEKLYYLDGNSLQKLNCGQMQQVVFNDINKVQYTLINVIFDLALRVLTAIAIIVIFFAIQPIMCSLLISFIAVISLVQKSNNKAIKKIVNVNRITLGKISEVVNDYLSNVMGSIMINAKNFLLTKYNKINYDYVHNSIKTATVVAVCNSKVGILNSLMKVFIFGIGGFFVIQGKMSLGGLTIFISYSGMIVQSIQLIMKSILPIQESIVSLEKIYSILDRKTIKSKNIISFSSTERNIEFKNVIFSYGNQRVLDKFNLNIEANRIIGIVARSGQGKSTLVKILFRLWDIEQGSVLINGKDISGFNIDFLRNNISVVNQDITLYNDTIYNNIVLGKDKIDDIKLEKILEKLGLNDFIECLPQKLNTIIGERGLRLSGGQRQKIAIARAIIMDAPIIIFDEATSALDNIAEKFIHDNIKRYIKNKTVIIIAHRLSTLSYCDEIFVMERGKVIEKGNQRQLLEEKGLYYNLYFSNMEE